MAIFAYNNAKNASTGHISFELNCSYHPRVSFKKNVNSRTKSCFADKLARELREQIKIYCQNLFHAQELQKRAYDSGINICNYVSGEKIWLNSKYIKTKRTKKLKSKFFGLFRVFYTIEK